MGGLRGGAPRIKLCWSWVPPGLQVAPAHMILPVTIIVYPPPNSLHEMLLSKWLHLISCYLTQDDTVFSIECLVIRFEWFLFFHLGESSSFTDHSGGLFVWKGFMFRYERVILDLTITNQYIFTTDRGLCTDTLSLNDKTEKYSYGWGVVERSVTVK